VPMPAGTVVVASGPLDEVSPGVLPGETTVWLA
jgi:alpha-glucosidase